MSKIILLAFLSFSAISFAQSNKVFDIAQDFGSKVFVDFHSQTNIASKDVKIDNIKWNSKTVDVGISYTDAEDHYYVDIILQRIGKSDFEIIKCDPRGLHDMSRHDPAQECAKRNK